MRACFMWLNGVFLFYFIEIITVDESRLQSISYVWWITNKLAVCSKVKKCNYCMQSLNHVHISLVIKINILLSICHKQRLDIGYNKSAFDNLWHTSISGMYFNCACFHRIDFLFMYSHSHKSLYCFRLCVSSK